MIDPVFPSISKHERTIVSQKNWSAVSIFTVVDLASNMYFPYESSQGSINRAAILLIMTLPHITWPELLSLEANTIRKWQANQISSSLEMGLETVTCGQTLLNK